MVSASWALSRLHSTCAHSSAERTADAMGAMYEAAEKASAKTKITPLE
jgi:hypothetical protein